MGAVTLRMVEPGWLDPTAEQDQWCHLMCLVPTVCPCNDDAWALVNEYSHTVAECECPCHLTLPPTSDESA